MKYTAILLGLAFVLASVSVFASAAHATVDAECAVVLKTPDGFLALRAGPGTRFEMKKKLKRGDFLVLSTDDDGGKWVEVEAKPCMTCRSRMNGWVYRQYTQPFVCPAELINSWYPSY
jgi:uncharacterized protein YraI